MLVYLLRDILRQMNEVHPQVDVEVKVIGTYDGYKGLAAGTLDIALIAPNDEPEELVATRWRRVNRRLHEITATGLRKSGAPGAIPTRDLPLRRRTLYAAELREHR